MGDPISKITNTKRADEVAEVVEPLPSKCEAKFNPLVPPKKRSFCDIA
jgi:hypothetical protein